MFPVRRTTAVALVVVGLIAGACAAPAPSETPADSARPTSAEASNVEQVLPTGFCAVIVKHIHRFADMDPELATVLDPPLSGAPFRVTMATESNLGSASASVSVFGENWGNEVNVTETSPDGTDQWYTYASRPRPDQSMTASLTEVGTHVIRMSSTTNECAATLVFEVAEPTQ